MDEDDGRKLVVLDPLKVRLRDDERPKRGQKTQYTPERGTAIADVLASTVMGVARLCKANPDWPDPITIVRWEAAHEDFRLKMGAARRARADMLMAEVVEIADDRSYDLIQIGENVVPNPVAPARSKIMCDVRLKVAAKLNPHKYGDKLDLTASGPGAYVSQEDAIRQLK
jgi:hypothetical protein